MSEQRDHRKRATVTAVFTAVGGQPVPRQVQLELRDGGYVWMIGGPTGWESFSPGPGSFGRGWIANVGDGRYANCEVPAAELDRALLELGFTMLGFPEQRDHSGGRA